MGAGSSSVNSEMKKYVDNASQEELVAAAAELDVADKEQLLAALKAEDWQRALLFYQEGAAFPGDGDSE